MADILDQNEIDALLDAVESGEVPAGQPGGGAAGSSSEGDSAEYPLYDFKRPERVSKEQMMALESINEVFARNFGASLSGYLRTIVDIRLIAVEQLTYLEFITSLPNPTCFNLLSAAPLEGEMVLEMNPSIIFPILDRLLGGGIRLPNVPERPLTEIELRLTATVTRRATDQLKLAWKGINEIDFKVTKTDSNPQLMQIIAPNEPVILASFEATVGKTSGTINLCIPYMVVEPMIYDLASQSWLGYSKRGARTEEPEVIAESLSKAPVEVISYLAETTITMNDLINLSPGDIIQTTKPCDSDILLCVEGNPKLRGAPGTFKDKKAMLVKSEANPKDDI